MKYYTLSLLCLTYSNAVFGSYDSASYLAASALSNSPEVMGMKGTGVIDKGFKEMGMKEMNNHMVDTSGDAQVVVIWVNHGGDVQNKMINEAMPMPSPGMTHNVIVGGEKGLIFEPEQIQAAVGDMVVFEFMSKNHTATQSSFDKPCEPLNKGMDSGFMPNPDNNPSKAPKMGMQVMGTNPIWFYCKQANHCGKGMTFSINPGSMGSGKTHEDFKAKAMMSAGGASPPDMPVGPSSTPAADPFKSPPPPPKDGSKGGSKDTPPPAKGSLAPAKDYPPPIVAPGAGQGDCSCSCFCGMSNFPNMGSQGIGSFGGLPGALPMSGMKNK